MTEQALRKMIAAGESTRQEFKSWMKCKDYRQRKELAVKSAVALANTKGGVLLFGVEDDGTITGCPKSDPQALMEAIYDMTRPSLFTEIEPVETSDGVVLVVSVEKYGCPVPPAKKVTTPFSRHSTAASLVNISAIGPMVNGVNTFVFMPTLRKISDT